MCAFSLMHSQSYHFVCMKAALPGLLVRKCVEFNGKTTQSGIRHRNTRCMSMKHADVEWIRKRSEVVHCKRF
jgi:hypothetical protein